MNTHFQIRCKCTKCERTQVLKISDVLIGAKCQLGRLGQYPCNGDINYYTEDSEDAKLNAVSILGFLNASRLFDNQPKLAELVDAVVDDVQTWMEPEATPQEMGWVDSQGRP